MVPTRTTRSPKSSSSRAACAACLRPSARSSAGFSTVMMEAFNIMQDRITRARLAGDPPDVVISPRLGNIGLIDFHRASEAIEIGAEAAERTLDAIGEVIAALR